MLHNFMHNFLLETFQPLLDVEMADESSDAIGLSSLVLAALSLNAFYSLSVSPDTILVQQLLVASTSALDTFRATSQWLVC